MTTEELAEAYNRTQNQQYLLKLHAKCKPSIYFTIKRMNIHLNDIDDVKQVAFISIMNCIKHYNREKGAFKTLFVLAFRRDLATYRLNSRLVKVPLSVIKKGVEFPNYFSYDEREDARAYWDELDVEKSEECDLLQNFIQSLSPRRKKLIGFYLAGKTTREIAAEFNVSQQAVSQQLQRIIQKWKEQLE